ncbi:MAG: type-F conjugative transfer system pilin assembly protein TrbC, partial [Dictyoglomus turgidum]
MLPRSITLIATLVLTLCVVSYATDTREVFIPLPDECFLVDAVEGDKIFLKRIENCTPGPVQVPMAKVKVNRGIDKVKIYIDSKLWQEHEVASSTMEQQISSLYKAGSSIKVDMPKNPEAEELAKQSFYYTQTPEFQAKLEAFKEDILGSLTGTVQPQYYSELRKTHSLLASDERLYVFVSSSMPLETVRAYARALSQIGDNGYLVLRGAIGGLKYLRPTADWTLKVLKKDPYCEVENCELYGVKLLIDPFLFKKYQIDRVPAIVFVRGLDNPEGLSEGLDSVKVSSYWVSFGDVALSYHLKLIGEASQDERIKRLAQSID